MRPKRLKLGLHTYPVRYVPGIIEGDEGKELCGRSEHTGSRRGITVSVDESDDVADTLLHEALHGLFCDRSLGHMCHSKSSEEALIASLSTGLLAAFRENKGFAEFLETGS